jgi:hypothetical protein
MMCDGCQQKFTCSCTKPGVTVTITPTFTPSPTVSGTQLPTPSPTKGVTLVITAKPSVHVTYNPTSTIKPTNTLTPSPTIYIPTITGTIVDTDTPTPTDNVVIPTTDNIPATALISDEIDRLLIGIVLVSIGIFFYSSGKYALIGNLPSYLTFDNLSLQTSNFIHDLFEPFGLLFNKPINYLRKNNKFFDSICLKISKTSELINRGINKKLRKKGIGAEKSFEKDILKDDE